MVSSLASNYVKVVLGGQGGDETLGDMQDILLLIFNTVLGLLLTVRQSLMSCPFLCKT